MKDNNTVILAEVKDMDEDKWEESIENKEKKAYIFTFGAYKYSWDR